MDGGSRNNHTVLKPEVPAATCFAAQHEVILQQTEACLSSLQAPSSTVTTDGRVFGPLNTLNGLPAPSSAGKPQSSTLLKEVIAGPRMSQRVRGQTQCCQTPKFD
ncbi:unnamed protein product [Prorocentrum cordatum]|uniref:Uncharacterized protein n=1 Tax=Prorocentrum cordatum TaxID=2364126 RepID=A0ABN9W7C2_9DINO|nr:unnamed protein product [Polarella glacialis]